MGLPKLVCNLRHPGLFLACLLHLQMLAQESQNRTDTAAYANKQNAEISQSEENLKGISRLTGQKKRLDASLSPFSAPLIQTGEQDIRLLKNIFHPGFHVSSATLSASSVYNRSLLSNDSFSASAFSQHLIHGQLSLDINGIPVRGEYVFRESVPQFLNNAPKSWYKIALDAEGYHAKWKKLAEKLGPEALTKSGGQISALQTTFKQELSGTYRNLVSSGSEVLFDSISQVIDPLALESKTKEELEGLLFGQNLQTALTNAQAKRKEIEAQDLPAHTKDSLLNNCRTKIEELENKGKYIRQVQALLEIAKQKGTLEKLKELKAKTTEEYQALMKDKSALIQRLAEKYKMGGVMKLVSLLSQFKAGGQTLPFSSATNVPFLGKAISLELDFGEKYIGFSMGSILSVSPTFFMRDSVANRNSSGNQQSGYWHLHFRKGRLASDHKGFKLTSIKYDGQNDRQLQPLFFTRKRLLLIELYSKERLFNDHWLSLEASKSMLLGDKPKQTLLNLRNVSFKIATEGKFENAGIQHNAYYRKLLGAYNNYTDNSFTSDGYEAGLFLRLRPKASRISTTVRGRLQRFQTPGTAKGEWRNSSLRTQFGYRLGKGQSVQLSAHWQEGYKVYAFASAVRMIRQQSHNVTTDFTLVNKRIFGLYNTTFLSLGYQQDVFPVDDRAGKESQTSKAYSVTVNQTFFKGEHLLQVNAAYTNVAQSQQAFFYNTRLDVEGGGSFRLRNNLSFSAFLVYGSLKDAYSNLGIKSSLSAALSKAFALDVYVDMRKNIHLENPLFSQFLNFNCDLKYFIK